MSQHDMDISNASGATVRADINNALKALASFNSGVGAPATPYAYEMYVDTSTLPGSDAIVYIRNGANTAWARWGYINKTTGILIPDNATDASGFGSGVKMLFYQDTAPTGWVILNTLDDKLLYVTKGSAAGGQTGGTVHDAGTWTQPNHSHSHTHTGPSHTHTQPGHIHKWYEQNSALVTDQTFNSGGSLIDIITAATKNAGITCIGPLQAVAYPDQDYYTNSSGGDATGAGGTGATGADATAGATANTWRPAAYCAIICQRS